MEAQQVTEKILADARAEAQSIEQQALQSQQAEQEQLQKQLQQYAEQTQALAEKAAESERSHLLAAARMDIAKQYLAEKRKILDDLFRQAYERLQSLGDDEYRQLIAKLLLQAVETGDEQVVLDVNESRIDQELINQVNEQLRPQGKGNLTLAEQRQPIGGGFILKRGKIKTNVSFSVLLDQARTDLEIELAKELFPAAQE